MPNKKLDLLGKPEEYRWVPLSALKAGECLSCIDGRHEECIIAAPGGDVGELILLLSAVEHVAGSQLTTRDVDRCLSEVMEWHSRFYMHTDEASLRQLGDTLRADPDFRDVIGLDSLPRLANFVRHPRREFRSALARYLVQPKHVGCGHLNTMLTFPERYGLRAGLVVDVILGFYRRMWHGSPSTNFVVLPGDHAEKAVLLIDLDEEPLGSTFVPSLRSGVLGHSRSFVVHEAARRFLRRESLNLLIHSAAIDPRTSVTAVEVEAERRSSQHLEATLDALAPTLPRYRITFQARTHEYSISEQS